MSAMPAVSKLIKRPLGHRGRGRPFNPLTADVLSGGGNVSDVPLADSETGLICRTLRSRRPPKH